jgi:hypothetical protein
MPQRNILAAIFLRTESSGESVGFTVLEFPDTSIGISMSEVLNANFGVTKDWILGTKVPPGI